MSKISEIKDCKYICSLGLIQACNQENNIIKYDAHVNETHDFSNIENIAEGSCVVIKSDMIIEFIQRVLPRIRQPFILFTANSDSIIPTSFLDKLTFYQTIENPKIIHWYSVNCLENLHKKLTQVPIGMNFHCSTQENSENRKMWHDEVLTPQQQEAIMDNIRQKAPPFYERELTCYSNFHFNTYAEFGNPRERAIRDIPKELVFYEPTYAKRIITWENQAKHAFVLSPLGHGLDCHRTWEALVLGCIVVVETSPLDSLYRDLPVLILQNWADLNEEVLRKTVEDFKTRSFGGCFRSDSGEISPNNEGQSPKLFDYERITLQYWHHVITGK